MNFLQMQLKFIDMKVIYQGRIMFRNTKEIFLEKKIINGRKCVFNVLENNFFEIGYIK